jgi:hypothetical protein
MATGTTTHLGLTTVETGDRLPQTVSKTNFEIIDSYVAARKLTNKSGGTLPAGTVCIADTTTDSSFTTTSTAGKTNVVGILQASTAANATGLVKQYGVSNILVNAATARGDWLSTSTTVGQAAPTLAASPAPSGAFAIALTSTGGAGTVTAVIIATSTGLGDPTTTAGDILYRNSTAVTRLAIGTALQVLRTNSGATAPEWATLAVPTNKWTAATQTVSASTTLVDVIAVGSPATMSFSIAASEIWRVVYTVPLSFTGTGGVKFQITGPSAPTAVSFQTTRPVYANTLGIVNFAGLLSPVTAFASNIAAGDAAGATDGLYTTGTNGLQMLIVAYIANGANAGTITLQFAQNSANGTTIIGIGAIMTAQKMN